MLRSVRAERLDPDVPLTAPLVRAARAGLRLGLLDLARLADVSIVAISRIENGACGERDEATVRKLRLALEGAGAEFPQTDAGPVLRFRREPA